MRNFGMPDLHGSGSQSFSDVADPVMTVEGSEGLGDRLVERSRCDIDRVGGLVQIVDNDRAGFKRHDDNLPYSLFVRSASFL